MNLIQSSVLYNYLYSPKSWLHSRTNKTKIFTISCCLIYLPYMSLYQIFCTLLILLCLYKSIKMPNLINKNLKKTALIFLFFITINVQDSQMLTSNLVIHRKYIQIYPLNKFLLIKKEMHNSIELPLSYLISLSFIRLLSIHFISLLIIRLLLITTLYENILYLFFKDLYRKTNQIYQSFFYEVNIAIEFIQAIFQYLELIKYSYIIRFLHFNRSISFIEHLIIHFFCIKQLIINIQKQIYTVAESFYSREIY